MIPTELPVEHLLTLTALTARPRRIEGGPQGTRGIIGVTGGTFEGPRLRGSIVPPGGDWFTRRGSGSLRLDVRLLLVTEDEVNILMTYSGIAVPRDDGTHIRIAAQFEAPERYGWLNDVQAVGTGATFDGGVRYEVYALS